MKQKIKRLTEYINELDYFYHGLGKPKVSDQEYDSLFKQLISLEKKYPEYIQKDSPCKKVGYFKTLRNVERSSEHLSPMYSLSNVFTVEELLQWLRSTGISEPIELYADLKLDGMALRLRYADGKLIEATTRGDGKTGIIVTAHAKRIHNVPHGSDDMSTYEVYGEVILPTKEFDKLNANRVRKGKIPYSTPRSAISALMRMNDAPQLRNAVFVAYGSNLTGYTQYNAMLNSLIEKYDFQAPESVLTTTDNLTIIEKFYKEFNNGKIGKECYWPYVKNAADGIVIKINDLSICEKLGYTEKYPKFQTAWKFSNKTVETRILDIIYSFGRTGIITPVAILEPVYINGIKVTRSTLVSESNIIKNNFFKGNVVEVIMRGNIIPKINKTICITASTQIYKRLKVCPCCGTEVQLRSQYMTYCTNEKCKGIIKARLRHFISRRGFDIKGLGEKLISTLVDADIATCFSDICNLTPEKLEPILSPLEADKLLTNISILERQIGPFKLLRSIGIPGVYTKDLNKLVKYIKDTFSQQTPIEWIKCVTNICRDMKVLLSIELGSNSTDNLYIYFTKHGWNEIVSLEKFLTLDTT